MKHFLPSSVMLMPFVVKNYPEVDIDDEISCDPYNSTTPESKLDLSTDSQPTVKESSANKQPKKE